jgi:hypothetical protein
MNAQLIDNIKFVEGLSVEGLSAMVQVNKILEYTGNNIGGIIGNTLISYIKEGFKVGDIECLNVEAYEREKAAEKKRKANEKAKAKYWAKKEAQAQAALEHSAQAQAVQVAQAQEHAAQAQVAAAQAQEAAALIAAYEAQEQAALIVAQEASKMVKSVQKKIKAKAYAKAYNVANKSVLKVKAKTRNDVIVHCDLCDACVKKGSLRYHQTTERCKANHYEIEEVLY